MSQQRSTAAEQLWVALQESKCLADTLKAPWRAEEACQQLAELLESVTGLLSHVFGRYRDSLFMGGLNAHLQSSAQLLHFGLLKASRVADSCCDSRGPCAYSNSSTSLFTPSEAIQSTATSAAADIQLAVTVLATAVQYLEATQTLKHAEAAAVHYIANMKTGQLLRNSMDSPINTKVAPVTCSDVDTAAAGELPIPAATTSTAASDKPAADGSLLRSEHVPRSSTTGQQRQLQHAGAAAAAGGISTNSTDLAVFEAAVAANAAVEAVQTAQESLQSLQRQQQQLMQQQCVAQPLQQQQTATRQDANSSRNVADAAASVTAAPVTGQSQNSADGAATGATTSRPRSPFESSEIPKSAYDSVRLQALRELLVPGTTWSVAEGGSNFQYISPTSGIVRSVSARQQRREQEPPAKQQQGMQETAGGLLEPQQQQQQQGSRQVEAAPISAESPRGSDNADVQQQQQQQQSEGVQSDSEQEMAHTSTWLAQQLQQVYNNPLLQGPKPQQQRHSLLRHSLETSSGTAPPSNLQGFAIDPGSTLTNSTAKQQQQQQQGAALISSRSPTSSTAGGLAHEDRSSNPGPEGRQQAAVPVAATIISSTSSAKADQGGLGVRVSSEPGAARRSTADLVSDLLGRHRASSSSSPGHKAPGSSNSSVRSSWQGSLLGAGGFVPPAAARHSTGGSSSTGWARNSVSSGGGGRQDVLVTSATGASLVQMLAAATAGAASSSDTGGLAAAVRQQLSSPVASDPDSVTDHFFADSPAAGANAINTGNIGGLGNDSSECPAVVRQLLGDRYHRHTADVVLSGSSSRSLSSSSMRYPRHTVDGVLQHRNASPSSSRGCASPHQGVLGPRNSNALRGSSSSSDAGSSRSYAERHKRSSSRPRSAGGAAGADIAAADPRQHSPVAAAAELRARRHTAEAAAAGTVGRTLGQQSLASLRSAAAAAGGGGGNRCSADTVSDSGAGEAAAAAGRLGSTGLEALVQQQQQRWQRQQQDQSRQQGGEVAARTSVTMPAAAAAAGGRGGGGGGRGGIAAAADVTGATLWQQQQQDSDFEQQWQQQQQLWQQQQQERRSSRGDGSRRNSTAGNDNMHELSFSVDGSSQQEQQQQQENNQPLVSTSAADTDLLSAQSNGRRSSSSSMQSTPAKSGASSTSFGEFQSGDAAATAAAAADMITTPVSMPRASGRGSYSSAPATAAAVRMELQDTAPDSSSIPRSSANRSSLMAVSTDGAAATPAAAGDSCADFMFNPTSSSNNRSSLMTLSASGATQAAAAAAAAHGEAAAPVAAAAARDPGMAAAATLLTSGNAAYTAGNYAAAASDYRAAMDKIGGSLAHVVSDGDSNLFEDSHGRTMLLTKCSLNLACCHLRLGQYRQCLAECDAIMEVDPKNVVALCHRGRALLMLQQPTAAKADLEAAQQLLAEEAGQQQGLAATAVAARPVSPNTLARMRLNNSYWQQRVQELLGKLPTDVATK